MSRPGGDSLAGRVGRAEIHANWKAVEMWGLGHAFVASHGKTRKSGTGCRKAYIFPPLPDELLKLLGSRRLLTKAVQVCSFPFLSYPHPSASARGSRSTGTVPASHFPTLPTWHVAGSGNRVGRKISTPVCGLQHALPQGGEEVWRKSANPKGTARPSINRAEMASGSKQRQFGPIF